MRLRVSALCPEDRQAWEALYRGYADFYRMPMEAATLQRVWQWIFDPNNRFFALIAKDQQDRGIGLMHYREMPSPIRGAMVGFLDDLYVDPMFRGQGVVELLFERLHQEAQVNGWPLVRWITAEDNLRARAVYQRLSEKTPWVTYQLSID
ncbi:GNAT family N-acetyltransferase [Motiliproteus sp.]|uniref:GNAT family N-acetyltransferase n=1 Tax=Motiliproteus sp. TaxID=1898955 RepID=UPI003BACD810